METDFWKLRSENEDGEAIDGYDEQCFEFSDLQATSDDATRTNKILFDIKGQLVALNLTLGTLGEMFGDYIQFLKENNAE